MKIKEAVQRSSLFFVPAGKLVLSVEGKIFIKMIPGFVLFAILAGNVCFYFQKPIMTLYRILVLIHVFSAILGIGPGFVLIYVVTKATNLTELRHAYVIRKRLHNFIMVGGTLLILTGLLMGVLRPYLFYLGWYVTSLILFLIALGFGPAILSPLSKPIKSLLRNTAGEEIPEAYYRMSKKLFFYERIENVLFLIIIVLMVLKPF